MSGFGFGFAVAPKNVPTPANGGRPKPQGWGQSFGSNWK